MELIIREYRTTPSKTDLTGACPGIDWKGDKRLEQILLMVQKSDTDWQALPEEGLEKFKNVPEGTRVTRLFYRVFIYTVDPDPEVFATYDHCDFPDAMARQMADLEPTDETISGLFIQACCSIVYPNGYEDECYVMTGKTFKLSKYHTGDPFYPGSPHIALLLLMAKEKEEWNNPSNYDLSDGYPLNLTEQASLFRGSHFATRLAISLGRNRQKATSVYCTIDAKDFPQRLIDQLADDDTKGLLNDVTSIDIDATVETSIRTIQRSYTITLTDDYPPKWDVCKVSLRWQADRNMFEESICYARPGTFAAFKYQNIYSLHPIRIDDMPVPERGARLFGIPQILWYDGESMTISYGERNITITPGKPFEVSKGIDYATFYLTISLQIDN